MREKWFVYFLWRCFVFVCKKHKHIESRLLVNASLLCLFFPWRISNVYWRKRKLHNLSLYRNDERKENLYFTPITRTTRCRHPPETTLFFFSCIVCMCVCAGFSCFQFVYFCVLLLEHCYFILHLILSFFRFFLFTFMMNDKSLSIYIFAMRASSFKFALLFYIIYVCVCVTWAEG